MKILHLLFSILMLYFAGLQWNDPDRLIWIGIYAGAAIVSLNYIFSICTSCTKASTLILICICITMLFITIPGIYVFFLESSFSEILSPMQDNKPYIEQFREMLGLIIVLAYCIYTFLKLNKTKQ